MNENILSPKKYDIVVLGSGEGSKYVAWTFARQGKQVAVIERRYIGGSCPNIACLPSKNIIQSAKVASYFQRSEEFGITKDNFKINMSAVRDRKRKMVDGLIQMHFDNFKASGAELIIGSGRFVGPKTLEVALSDGGTRVVRGKKVIIGTGTRATIEQIPGLSESRPLTHIEALELDHVPEHLLILGGGYIGLELAQAMRRFGSRVTVIDRNERLAHREDEDVSEGLTDLCQAEGIALVMNARVTGVEGKSGQSVKLRLTRGGSEMTLEGTHLLAAIGRTPNTNGIGLELAGVELTDRGYIKVNERLETTAPDVWAIGECAGSPQFTHIAFDDFRVVRDDLAGGNRVTTGRQVPFCMFTDPELARVGLSETEAKKQGIAYRLAKIPMVAVLRTRTLSETRGFMKALIDTKSDRILGFTVLGVEAGEIMASVQIAMLAGLPYTALRDAIFTHPTLLEGLIPLFSSVPPISKSSESPAGLAELTRASLIVRFAAIGAVLAGIVGLFLYAGGWLTPHRLSPASMINRFEQVNGLHPGFRRNHAKGVCISGYFESNGRGIALSKASVFLPGRVPVIGRFSLAGGQPYVADVPSTIRGMGILFKLPDGEEWRIAMTNLPVFTVNTAQGFYDQLLASAVDPATGKPDPSRMSRFLAKHPESAKAIQLIRSHPVSSGFENSTYNSLNAFRFINAGGAVVPVRWAMVPVQPFEPVGTASPGQDDKNYLFDALIASIHSHPLEWHLVITLGQPGDPTNDATLPWPPDRQQIDAGKLTIDHVESEDTSPTRDINFDPLVLPNGIAASDDPLLSTRSAAYSQSFTRREGERKEPSAVSTAETEK